MKSLPLGVLASVLVAGCHAGRETGSALAPEPLRVAAASDLQAALPDLAERFRREHGTSVDFVVGASGQLAQQIRQGAPFDVFLSADRKFVADLAAAAAVKPDSVRPYARGSLVLAVHKASNPGVASIADLARPSIKKIALANPDLAPYGRAAKQALERAELWTALEPRIVRSETVRQALQFVQTGNAEAGFVGRAIAMVPEVDVVPIDPALYDPIVQGLGVVAQTKHPQAADAFARFLVGASGQEVLAKYGFSPPDAK